MGKTPEELLAEEALASSANGEEGQEQDDANAEGADQGAESSTAEGQGKYDAKKDDKQSLLSAVQDVLKPKGDADKSGDSSNPDGGKADDKTAADGKDGEKKPDAKAEDDANLPFHNHPRWQQVLAENRELKADAAVGASVLQYQENTGVNNDELKQLLEVGNLGKNDPEKAIPIVEQYLERLKAATGDKLPDDLAQKVKDGYMDEATALEVSRTRAAAARATARAETVTQSVETTQANLAAQEVVSAVDVWEKQQLAKDPDYAKKQPLVHAFVHESFAKNGKPKTKEDALALADEALKRANSILVPAAPKPMKHVPSKTGKSTAVAQPKSLLDAVKGAL